MKVLAIGAHPDDIELLCAGTLANHSERGDEVFMAVMTDGGKGHHEIPPERLVEIRRRESEEAAGVIGAKLIWVGIPDGEASPSLENRLRTIELIRRVEPDIIITHNPHDYHPDHRGVSTLVLDSIYLSTVPHIETGSPPCRKLPRLYYMDSVTGLGFEPEIFIDITESMEVKRRMLSTHRTQIEWLRKHDGVDIMAVMEDLARLRGHQCGVGYAEAFKMVRIWPAYAFRHLP